MSAASEISIGVVIGGRVRLHRDALADALGRTSDLRVLAAGRTRDEVRSAVERLQPDVVVVDLDNRSLDVVGELVAGGAPVVGVLSSDEDEELVALAELGLAGFVQQDDSVEDLKEAVRAAARGEVRCSPRTTAVLLRHIAKLAAERDNGHHLDAALLTRRELEVVGLMEAGLSNKQIAAELHIELPTVKHHVHHILEKLDVSHRGEAAARARAGGLLDG
jgi:two-component system, NarL family, nitrate/nitrite response regulator NarL